MTSTTIKRSCLARIFVFLFWFFFGFSDVSAETQQTLHLDEVEVLKKVNEKLKVGWDFSVQPCSGEKGWIDTTFGVRNATCGKCDANNTCHVTSILLKRRNLVGLLPPELSNLKYLENISDLTGNNFSGSIPSEWGSLKALLHLSLLGNRLSGRIPDEIANIPTLEQLVLENNLLEGPIPSSLGRLTNLRRLILSANLLSGELPDSLGNLTKLEDVLDGNDVSGKIPDFIGNWTDLKILHMQGTFLGGAFPPRLGEFKTLQELRISDFKGDGRFPPLQRITKLERLVLRNCSISGEIPDYIGSWSIKTLDLSFNNFTGGIPSTFYSYPRLKIDNLYLSNNRLSGTIPEWIWNTRKNVDLSYNYFTEPSGQHKCQQHTNLNVVACCSSSMDPCMRKNYPCLNAENYELHINCGGPKVQFEDAWYEADTLPLGPTSFFSENGKWAVSNTGECFYPKETNILLAEIDTVNTGNPVYHTARSSLSSLKYYGLCLRKGKYNVSLHFAEVIFDDNQPLASVGRRYFDVSIQGKKVLKDFNIVLAANGTHKGIVKNFVAAVDGGALQIHFQWAGRGTSSVPYKCAYGPLISAISITPRFRIDDRIDDSWWKKKLKAIVPAAVAAVLLILLVIWCLFKRKLGRKNALKDLELQTTRFSLAQIKTATRNFDPKNKIGQGGFGSVFKGVLPDGRVVAVKQHSSKSMQGNREFVTEIGIISALQHPNLVKLVGCCIDGNQLLLVYEYMENNSLSHVLFDSEGGLKLKWQARRKICLGIAQGLTYLHEESRLKVVHRDIKTANILLDEDLNAKISDFGIAKLDDQKNTHMSTAVLGTRGYMAPEYAMRGHLTDKADVYSFGIVMLEVVSGQNNYTRKFDTEDTYLLDWACILEDSGRILELVDPTLGLNYSKEEAEQMLKLALACTNTSPNHRPTMSAVVSILEGREPVNTAIVYQSKGKLSKFITVDGSSHYEHGRSSFGCEISTEQQLPHYDDDIPR